MSNRLAIYERQSFSRTGSLRPTSGPGLSKRSRNTNNGVERHKSKLPRGMYINHDDIVKLASQDSNNRGDDLLTNMDREISTLLSQVRSIIFIFIKISWKNRNGLICFMVIGGFFLLESNSLWYSYHAFHLCAFMI